MLYAQVGLTSAQSSLTFDGTVVATKRLLGAPGASQDMSAVARLIRRGDGVAEAAIEVDNVDIAIK